MRQTEQRLREYFQNQEIWKGDSDSEEIEQMALTKTIQLAELEQRERKKKETYRISNVSSGADSSDRNANLECSDWNRTGDIYDVGFADRNGV